MVDAARVDAAAGIGRRGREGLCLEVHEWLESFASACVLDIESMGESADAGVAAVEDGVELASPSAAFVKPISFS